MVYIFLHEKQLKREKLDDYTFYNQFIVLYNDGVCDEVDMCKWARQKQKKKRSRNDNNEFEGRSGISCLHPNGNIEIYINYVWCKGSKS